MKEHLPPCFVSTSTGSHDELYKITFLYINQQTLVTQILEF